MTLSNTAETASTQEEKINYILGALEETNGVGIIEMLESHPTELAQMLSVVRTLEPTGFVSNETGIDTLRIYDRRQNEPAVDYLLRLAKTGDGCEDVRAWRAKEPIALAKLYNNLEKLNEAKSETSN